MRPTMMDGAACRSLTTKKRRCRLHAGASGSGGRPGERNGAYRHGERTKAAIAKQRKFTAVLKNQQRDVAAQLVVGDSKNTITLARSSADVSPPYGFMLLPGTTSSSFAMKRSSFSLSHTNSAPFMALE